MISQTPQTAAALPGHGNGAAPFAPFGCMPPEEKPGNTGNSYHVTPECYQRTQDDRKRPRLSQNHDGNGHGNGGITALPHEITLPEAEDGAGPGGESGEQPGRQAALTKNEVCSLCQQMVDNHEIPTARKVYRTLRRGSMRTIQAMVSEFCAEMQLSKDKDILDLCCISPQHEDSARKLLADATREIRDNADKALKSLKDEYEARLRRESQETAELLEELEKLTGKNQALTVTQEKLREEVEQLRKQNAEQKNQLHSCQVQLDRQTTRDSFVQAVARLLDMLMKDPDKIKTLEDLLKAKSS